MVDYSNKQLPVAYKNYEEDMKNVELISLVKEPTDFQRIKVISSSVAANYAKPFFEGHVDIYESMFILLLNRANKTIGYAKISQGGIAETVIDVKIIMKYAVDSLASGVILFHNHPSGNDKPSDADLEITRKAKSALKLMDVILLDHIIITSDTHTSLADEGLL